MIAPVGLLPPRPGAARGWPQTGSARPSRGVPFGRMGEEATGGDRQRLTVPEAATVLGVTVDAVRGRIRRGNLPSEHDEHGKVYVWLDASEADRPGPSADREELVESLLEQVTYMREQLAAERNAHAETRRIAYTLAQRIPELEAAQETPQAPETPAETRSGTDAPADPGEAQEGARTRRPSWWRRFFGS